MAASAAAPIIEVANSKILLIAGIRLRELAPDCYSREFRPRKASEKPASINWLQLYCVKWSAYPSLDSYATYASIVRAKCV
jgi:hypothetical protein